MTTRDDIRRWLQNAKDEGSTHVVVMTDTFEHDDYPVYATSGSHARSIVREKSGNNMQQLREVYAVHLDWEKQLFEHRAMHYEDPPKELTPTGRTSQEVPVQNIPLRTEAGKKLREVLQGPAADMDYAALEHRVLASYGPVFTEMKVGAVVQLKSGGQKMTVEAFYPEDKVGCVWFYDGRLNVRVFDKTVLEIAPKEET